MTLPKRDLTHETIARSIASLGQRGKHVTLDLTRLEEVARVMKTNIASQWWRAYREAPEHYQFAPLQRADDDAIMFSLLTSAQMWLIWERAAEGDVVPWHVHIGDELFVGAAGITASHHRAIAQNRNLLDPAFLAQMELADVEAIYRDDVSGQTTLQNLPGRLAKFNELGRVLQAEFDGRASGLLERAQGYLYRDDGQGLIQLLAGHFPASFDDWPFYKLPIVVVLSLWSLRESDLPATDEFMRLTAFQDLGKLEGGADYYRPFFLMRLGMLVLRPALKAKLSEGVPLERDCEEEQEIRATTLLALRALVAQIGEFPQDLPGVEVETHAMAFLQCRHCKPGLSREELLCPYDPICAAHDEDRSLLQLGWPLVDTTAY